MKELQKHLAKVNDSKWRSEVEFRQENKDWLKKSTQIAIKTNRAMKSLAWSQTKLAEEMGASKQYVNKILRGKENLTLETITKLEKALGIQLMSVVAETVKNNTEIKQLTQLVAKLIDHISISTPVIPLHSVKTQATFKAQMTVQKNNSDDQGYLMSA